MESPTQKAQSRFPLESNRRLFCANVQRSKATLNLTLSVFSVRNLKSFFVGGVLWLLACSRYPGVVAGSRGKTQATVTTDSMLAFSDTSHQLLMKPLQLASRGAGQGGADVGRVTPPLPLRPPALRRGPHCLFKLHALLRPTCHVPRSESAVGVRLRSRPV